MHPDGDDEENPLETIHDIRCEARDICRWMEQAQITPSEAETRLRCLKILHQFLRDALADRLQHAVDEGPEHGARKLNA